MLSSLEQSSTLLVCATALAWVPQPAYHPIHRIREITGPALVNTLIDPILSLIDTLFVGRLGSSLTLGAQAARKAGPPWPGGCSGSGAIHVYKAGFAGFRPSVAGASGIRVKPHRRIPTIFSYYGCTSVASSRRQAARVPSAPIRPSHPPAASGAVACSSELFTLCFAVSLALRESASSTLSRLAGTNSEEEVRQLQQALGLKNRAWPE